MTHFNEIPLILKFYDSPKSVFNKNTQKIRLSRCINFRTTDNPTNRKKENLIRFAGIDLTFFNSIRVISTTLASFRRNIKEDNKNFALKRIVSDVLVCVRS